MSSSSLNVDQRIVQMQFDNAQFEQGVTTTMGTLDKLKNSLNFTGQANGIENLSKSFGKVNANPLISAVETAKGRFSALEIAAITAISNITTKVQMMGERIVSAVTIDPVKTGWSEYEQKMDSIKTILNSAKDENGMAVSLDQVKKKIEELNTYADKTIYSFSDMTNNIGKFTNAGVDLDTAVAAIQGVANAAAAAGADSNAASRAMYNFAQSLSVGYMQRMDWKSIENANMATTEFKDELLKTAEAMGTVKKDANGLYTSLTADTKKAQEGASAAAMFTEKLSTKWLTNDVLIKTLNRYSDTSTDIGKKAEEAATKVFTLSKMFDTLKEAMQSGWSATWEKIVGDYEQAGELFTGINDFISGAIGKRDQKRIDFLDELLNKADAIDKKEWDMFKFDKDKEEINMFKAAIKQAAREQGIEIDKMINKNQGFRESLKEGWLTDDILKKAQDKLKEYNKLLESDRKKAAKEGDKKHLSEFEAETQHIENLSKSIKELGEATDKTGRELLLESFKKIFDEVMRVYNVMKTTYETVFPKSQASEVYKIIQAIRDWTNGFSVSTTALYRFRDILKGVFSVIKLFTDVIKMAGDIVWSIAGRFRRFGEMVLSVAGSIGRMVDNFRQSAEQGGKFKKIVEIITDSFDNLTSKINKFVNGGSISQTDWLDFKNTLTPKDQKTYIKAVKKVAQEHGINVQEMIDQNGSFGKSLKEGWFTKDLFNEVNYYFDNITRKGTTGVRVWSNEEFKALKRIRKQLNDNESAYSKMGAAAGKSGTEVVMEKVEKAAEPLSGILDRIIEVLPKVLKTLGSIASFIGGRIFGGAKLVWKIITTIYNAIANISKETKDSIIKNLGKVRNFLKKIYNIGKDIVKKFVDKIKENLPKIKEDFKTIGDKAKDLKDALKDAYDNIKDFVNKAGEMMDIKGVVKSVAKFFTALAGLTFEALLWAIDKITAFFKYISGNSTVNKVFSALGDALIKMFTKLESGVSKVKTFVSELLKLDGTQKAIENIKEFFKNIGGTLFENAKGAFTVVSDLFKGIGEGLPTMETVLTTINDLLTGTKDKFEFIKETVSNFFDLFRKKEEPNVGFGNLKDVKSNASDAADDVDEAGGTIKGALTRFVTSIEEGMEGLNSGKILHAGAWLGLIFIIFEIGMALKYLKQTMKNVSALTSLSSKNPINKFLGSVTGALTAWRKEVDANIVYTIAKSIGILAIAMVALCAIKDTKKLTQVTADLFIVMAGISLILFMMSKLFGNIENKHPASEFKEIVGSFVDNLMEAVQRGLKILAIGGSVALMAAGVFLVVGALINLYSFITQSNASLTDLVKAVGALAAVFAALIGAMWIIKKLDIKIETGTALALIGMAAAVNMLVFALKKLPKDPDRLSNGLFALVVMIGSLSASLAFLNWAVKGNGSELVTIAKSMIILAAAINLLLIPLAILSLPIFSAGNILAAGTAIALLAVGLGVLAAISSEFKAKNAAALLIASVAVAALVIPLQKLTSVDWGAIGKLAVVLGLFIASMFVLSLIGEKFGKGVTVIGDAMQSFGIAAAGFGAGAYLVIQAFAHLGDAVEGLKEFAEKIKEHGPIIAEGLAMLIAIVCTALIANKLLLKKTAFETFMSVFGGIKDAVNQMIPEGKIALGVGLIALLFGVIGLLEAAMPGITDKVLGLIVTGINSLASAIINHSEGLVAALGNLVAAILIVMEEVIFQFLQGMNDFFGGVFDKQFENAREKWDKEKEIMMENIDYSASIKSIADKNKEATDEYYDSLPKADDVNERTHFGSSGKLHGGSSGSFDKPSTSSSEPDLETQRVAGEEEGTARIKGFDDGIRKAAAEYGLDGDWLSSLTTDTGIEEGKSNMQSLATLLTDTYGENFNVSSVTEDELTNAFGSIGVTDISTDNLAAMCQMLNKTTEEELKTDEIVGEELDNTKATVEAKSSEIQAAAEEGMGKRDKITTSQDISISANIDTKNADTAMVNAAKGMMDKYGQTIKDQKEPIKKKVENVMKGAANAAGSSKIKAEMYDAGSNAIQGLINGINDKLPTLRAKALEAARLIAKTTTSRPALDEHSPSKVMYRIGDYAMVGLINGFGARMDSLKNTALNASDSISSGATSALAQVSAMLSSDIDSTPTIRPVLDLSDVAKGAGQINGMLNGRTLSVNSLNASRLSSAMNARQNRSDPVLDALNNLSRNLTNQQPANVYNLNGITYDDGSNIATAIGMLAHAAVVEGRA